MKKKTIFKRWWFWLIIVGVLIFVFTPSDDSEDSSADAAKSDQSTEETVQNESENTVTEVPVTELPVTQAPITETPVTQAPVTQVPTAPQEAILTAEPEPVTYRFYGQPGWYDYMPEGTAGDTAFSVRISNITDRTFDFSIHEMGNLIFKHHTAEITSEYTGTYYGQQYTLNFFWSDPGVLEVYGFDTVAGMEFVNVNYYGAG